MVDFIAAIHRPQSAQEGRLGTMNRVANRLLRFCVEALSRFLILHLFDFVLQQRLYLLRSACADYQSHDSAPPDWYSMTRVSKKLRSFFRSIISLIQGKGFSSFGKSSSKPICVARRFAM